MIAPITLSMIIVELNMFARAVYWKRIGDRAWITRLEVVPSRYTNAVARSYKEMRYERHTKFAFSTTLV